MKEYWVVYRDVAGDIETEVMSASDLPAAVAGFYAMKGPASGGTLKPEDLVRVAEID
jgi:hypothetical protein